jgi:large subunit ribosomal protein L18
MELKQKRYMQRKKRVRAKASGTEAKPRLTVFKSANHIYAQIVDDVKQVTLASASDLKSKAGKKTEKAAVVGEELAKKAVSAKIKKVVFDRNGFIYHGRIKALAEGARKGGLEF